MREINDAWIVLSGQYLKTSKLIMEQIRANENRWVIVDDWPIEWTDYFEKTKWSDFNTFVPSLFLMQHGLELLIKGLYLWFEKSEIDKNHKLNNLIIALAEDARIDSQLIELFNDYCGNSPKNKIIKEFNKLNKHLSTNNIHVNLRYPENQGNTIDFSPFRYKTSELLPHIDRFITDIDKIYDLALKTIRG